MDTYVCKAPALDIYGLRLNVLTIKLKVVVKPIRSGRKT